MSRTHHVRTHRLKLSIHIGPSTLSGVVRSKTDARRFIRESVGVVGLGFHPDTSAADYVDRATGQQLMNPASQQVFDAALGRAFQHLGDEIYEVGRRAQEKFQSVDQPYRPRAGGTGRGRR